MTEWFYLVMYVIYVHIVAMVTKNYSTEECPEFGPESKY